MNESLYWRLSKNPPKFDISGTPREIKIDLVSVMCDNKYRWTLKKNEDGDYKINTHSFAFSNFQTKMRKDDIEWLADEGSWQEVIDAINEGTSKVHKIKFR